MYDRHKYSDRFDHAANIPEEDAYYSIKHDGANYFLNFDKQGFPSFISRRMDVKGGYPDRTSKVPHLAKQMPEYAGRTFNVELIHTGHNHNAADDHAATSGILNSLPPKAIATQQATGPVRMKIFDVRNDPALDTYGKKLDVIRKFVSDFNDPYLASMPEAAVGHAAGATLAKNVAKAGGEGVVITSLSTPESENIRYKVKNFATYNLRVVGIKQEVDIKGNPKQMAGALILADASGRIVCDAGSGLTHAMKVDIWNNPTAWIGKLVQVKAMKPTATKLRHPVYNGDADGDLDLV